MPLIINDLSLGEYSAGNAKQIPDNAARELKNIIRKNGQLVRRDGIDTEADGLMTEIGTNPAISDMWSWKPALRISGRGDLYYFVLYEDNTAIVFYKDGSWKRANLDIEFDVGSSLTIFASPESLLISDGISPPSKVYLKTDGTLNYDLLGLKAPTSKPILSNAKYTDETDQSIFSEVGLVRVAFTFVDKNGIESNPSPISDAYNGQRFKYVDGVQSNYIQSINMKNICVEQDDIASINIYTQVIKFSEGEDSGIFTLSDNYPVRQGENSFTLYKSGTDVTTISYENDVLKVADNITKTGDVIVVSTGDQIYSGDSKFRFLQPILLKNVNAQTIIDKPVRIRLYNEYNSGALIDAQVIINFNALNFKEDTGYDFIRIYDDDLSTALNVFVVELDQEDFYMEVIVKLSMNAGVTKKIYLAFTPPGDRKTYLGSSKVDIDGKFGTDVDAAAKVFSNIDVGFADTRIACYADNTADIGRVNLADENLGILEYLQNLTNASDISNFPIPYLYNKAGIQDSVFNSGYSTYISIASDDKKTSPKSWTAYCRCNHLKYTTDAGLARIYPVMRSKTDEDSVNRSLEFVYISTLVGEVETSITCYVIERTDYDGGRAYIYGSFDATPYYFGRKLDWFVVWSSKQGEDENETHNVYIYPLNAESSGMQVFHRNDINESNKVIAGFYYGHYDSSTMHNNPWGITANATYPSTISTVQCGYIENLFLENSTANKESISNFANYMPLYLTDVVGRKFRSQEEQNSNFSLDDQVDFSNLGNYENYILRWSDKSGENFSDLNYHRLDNKCTANLPVMGFYNNQYAPTILSLTEGSISRLVIDDITNTKAGANTIVGEQSGYGSEDDDYVAKYGNIIYWYSKAKNHCYMYDGESIKNLSLDRVEFTLVSKIFINNATRQLVVVGTDEQYIYSLEYGEWYSATGLDVTAATNIEDGKSLINIDGQLKQYPSLNETTEETKLVTKQYATDGMLIDRVKVDFDGSGVGLEINTAYRDNNSDIPYSSISAFQSYGITRIAGFLFFTLTGVDGFASISADIRRL